MGWPRELWVPGSSKPLFAGGCAEHLPRVDHLLTAILIEKECDLHPYLFPNKGPEKLRNEPKIVYKWAVT